MCMSFADLTLDRQEEVLAHMGRYGATAFRIKHSSAMLSERYAELDTADLVAHRAHAQQQDAGPGNWAHIVSLIQEVLDQREAVGREADQLTAAWQGHYYETTA
jgi:hypothetical protein